MQSGFNPGSLHLGSIKTCHAMKETQKANNEFKDFFMYIQVVEIVAKWTVSNETILID